LGTPLLEQLACSWLLANAATLLPPRREMLKARRDMCEELMKEYFPRWRFTPPEGGLSFWVELPDMLATLFSARAESQGIHRHRHAVWSGGRVRSLFTSAVYAAG
jgi:DNA-binding transcriptional MocR family regulator